MRSRWAWLRDRPWLLALVVVLVVTVPGFVRVEQLGRRTNAVVTCVSDWADQTAARSQALSVASAERQEKLDILLRAASVGDVAALRAGLTDYVAASDRFTVVVQEHPVPPAPRLVC